MRRNGMLLTAAMLLLAAHIQLYGQTTTVGHEKEWLTAHYYQIQFLTRLDPLSNAATKTYGGQSVNQQELSKEVNAAQIEIRLSNIVAGPITDILNRKYFDLFTLPAPPREVLEVNVGGHDHRDGDLPNEYWETATARWKPARPIPPDDLMAVYKTWTVERELEESKKLVPGTTYTRYATFEVSLAFQGKTVTYNVLYYFGTDAQGGEVAMPKDGFLETNMGLYQEPSNQIPSGLLHTHLTEYPPLNSWLKANTVISDQSCTAGKFCCVGSQCGISSADLDKELSKPKGAGAHPFPRTDRTLNR